MALQRPPQYDRIGPIPMKTLLVLRHAKSSWDTDREDFDRPLSKRGKRDAPRVGELVLQQGLCPDVILSSPARRARHTAEAVNRVCGEAVLTLQDEFYPGGPQDYVRALHGLGESVMSAMIVGHNPGLEDWLSQLGFETEKFPTAALVHIELPVTFWRGVQHGLRGTVRGFWKPREL